MSLGRRFLSFGKIELPVVVTDNISSVAGTSFTANGTLSSIGGGTGNVSVGFYIGTSTTYTSNAKYTVSTNASTGAFTYNATGLTSGTTYYVNAFAINDGGEAVGLQKTQATTSGYAINFLVIAGGGGGGQYIGGGGGAGGLRTSWPGGSGGGAASEATLNLVEGTSYSATVGAGGVRGLSPQMATDGYNSSFGSIVSIGGGGGGQTANATNGDGQSGAPGGSGGGTSYQYYTTRFPGAGTAGQGYAGAIGNNAALWGGGGGGAGGPGGPGTSGCFKTGAGAGKSVSISGSSISYASGGHGGGNGNGCGLGISGPANSGNGGGGSAQGSGGGSGGSGLIIIRIPTAKYSGLTTGSPVVTTNGGDTILRYNSSGTYTA